MALEAIVLFIVSFLPQSMNLLGNSLTSLACGLQVESFRKIHGNGIATTMCIGNLRSATQNLCEFLRTKNTEFARKSGLYFFTILCFTVGAIFGNLAVGLWAEKAILCASLLLVIAFCMMFVWTLSGNRARCMSASQRMRSRGRSDGGSASPRKDILWIHKTES